MNKEIIIKKIEAVKQKGFKNATTETRQVYIEHFRKDLLASCGGDIQFVERSIQELLLYLETNPNLMQCSAEAIISAFKLGALNGLSLTKQHYDLIVRGGVPNFQIRARGWYKIATEDKRISRIDVNVVWNGDEFSIRRENGKTIYNHTPNFEVVKNTENLKLAYGVIHWADGNYSVEYLTKGDLLKRKALAKSGTFWDKWLEEMLNKTIVKYCAMKHSVGINFAFSGEGVENYDEPAENFTYETIEE
jgi:recombinational DNA repair protein RecT